MRSVLVLPTIVGLVAALPAPAPQDIEFDLAYALPNPTYTEAVGATAQTVSYNPSTVYAAAAAQVTSSVIDTADATTETADASSNQKRAACAAQPLGSGPVPSPDTASAFLAFSSLSSAAAAATAPAGYVQQFSNLQGASSAYGYLGYTTLKSYDVGACSSKCNAMNGCISFNIYYERDPSVDPGTGDSGCTNPASTTNIKCSFWGGPLSSSSATNTGQWRNKFQVVIAGSNGYTNSSVASIPGYTPATPLGNAAINAPPDKFGYETYLGSAIFIGRFDAALCAKACTEKSNYARANPPTDGTPVQTCQFFNTYILYINTTSNVQGQYCAMYAETWGQKFATNVGQTRGYDNFKIQYSFSYSNLTNAGLPDPVPAVYQARKDILWPANSAQPYCSSLLGYTTPVSTTTTIATHTPLATTTTYGTETAFVTSTVASPATTFTTTTLVVNAKRDLAVPAALTKYPSNIVASACSLAVTPVSSMSIVTSTIMSAIDTVYSTQTISTTTTSTSVVVTAPVLTSTIVSTSTCLSPSSTPTPTPTPYRLVVANGAYAGYSVGTRYPLLNLMGGTTLQIWSKVASNTLQLYNSTSDPLLLTMHFNSDGKVSDVSDTFSLATQKDSNYPANPGAPYYNVGAYNLYTMKILSQYDYMSCSIGTKSDAVAAIPNAVGSLQCTLAGGTPIRWFGRGTGTGLWQVAYQAYTPSSTDTVLEVAVVSLSSTSNVATSSPSAVSSTSSTSTTTSYRLVVADGPKAGMWVGTNFPLGSIYDADVGFTDIESYALNLHIGTNGAVTDTSDTFGLSMRPPLADTRGMMRMLNATRLASLGYLSMSCSIGSPSGAVASVPNAVGLLQCSRSDGTPLAWVTTAVTNSGFFNAPTTYTLFNAKDAPAEGFFSFAVVPVPSSSIPAAACSAASPSGSTSGSDSAPAEAGGDAAGAPAPEG